MSKKNLSSRIACALLLIALSHAAATAQNRVTVMTWNVHGGNPPAPRGTGTNNCAPSSIPDPRASMTKVEGVVAEYNNKHQSAKIDALALQEIHRNQAVKLAQLLHYPAPYFVVTVRCDSNNSQLDYGMAILTPHKTALEKYYPIHTPDADMKREKPEYSRLAFISIMVHNEWLRVYTTHTSLDPAERQRQLSDIFDKIPAAGIRSVLTGDFNMPPSVPGGHVSATYNSVVRYFIDAWARKNPSDLSGGITTPYRDTPQRVDYIFLRKLRGEESGFNISSASVLNTGRVSDHFPVVAVLTYKPY